MIKVITLLKRKQGLSQDEFCSYWREKHAPLALRDNPQMVKYVQNHGVILPSGEQAYDGIAEGWYPDLDTFQATVTAFRSDEGKMVRVDLEKFVDMSQMLILVTEEVGMRE